MARLRRKSLPNPLQFSGDGGREAGGPITRWQNAPRMSVKREFDEASLQALDKSGMVLAAIAARDDFRRGDQLHLLLGDRRIGRNARREALHCGQAIVNEDHHVMTVIQLEARERFDKDPVRRRENVAREKDRIFVTDREFLQIGVRGRSVQEFPCCCHRVVFAFNGEPFRRTLVALLKRDRNGLLWEPCPTKRRKQGSHSLPLSR